jgi:hypothetical protein
MVRMVDPPDGSRSQSDEAKYTVDDDPDTVWSTEHFKQANFGHIKKGMGVLVNLGSPRRLSEVTVETSSPDVAMDIRTGPSDFGDNSAGDKKIVDTYKKLGDGDTERTEGTREVFSGFDPNQKYQYVLVFLTELPRTDDGRYQVDVEKIEVTGY